MMCTYAYVLYYWKLNVLFNFIEPLVKVNFFPLSFFSALYGLEYYNMEKCPGGSLGC
jgi:hypothetical protein